MKKIMVYNWIPFDEKENKGGGVTVYTNNLIRHFIKQKDLKVYFLSSGRAYNHKRMDTYIEQTDNIYGDKCRSFQIVNSPILSAANLSFPFPEDYLRDRSLLNIIAEFMAKEGPFDVVHYQNFEGLSLSVFELKKMFPETKFIFSIHNYYLFCPQVMMWTKSGTNCMDSCNGKACVQCVPLDVFREKIIVNQQINYCIEAGGTESVPRDLSQRRDELSRYYAQYASNRSLPVSEQEKLEAEFEEMLRKNILYANQYIDCFLAVSRRVAQIAVEHGLQEKKVKVAYIGTAVADMQLKHCKYREAEGIYYLGYLGYMREMKGFYFLLNALENMEDDLAHRIGIVIAAKLTDNDAINRINALKHKFADVILHDGYNHEQLPEILEKIHLGIVPVLWEDNLPQVAIEFKANGIPVLSSDLGGARELTRSEKFVFRAGDFDDFEKHVKCIIDTKAYDEYWNGTPSLTTMDEHVDALLQEYLIV